MTAIAADQFAGPTLAAWWTEYQAGLLSAPVSFVAGAEPYALFELADGGSAGSFWYNDDGGYLLRQRVIGDFDVAADMEIRNLAGTDVPPAGSPRLFGIAAHDPVRPESDEYSGGTVFQYYHRMFGRAPGATEDDSQPVGEWKYTRANVAGPPVSLSTWDTMPHPGPSPATSTRGWVRVARSGSTMSSWHAAPTGGPTPPPVGSPLWLDEHSISFPTLPELLHVGPQIYSAAGTGLADVSGRLFRIVPMFAT